MKTFRESDPEQDLQRTFGLGWWVGIPGAQALLRGFDRVALAHLRRRADRRVRDGGPLSVIGRMSLADRLAYRYLERRYVIIAESRGRVGLDPHEGKSS